MVDDGVIEMTVRVSQMSVTRTLGVRLTDGYAVMSARSDRLQKHLRRWHVSLVDWSVSWIEVPLRLLCTLPIKTSTSSSFFLLCAETSLSERVRHLSEPNRSHPLATRSTRSPLSSVSDPIRSSRCYNFNFYDRHGRSIKFLAFVSSPFFILDR